MAIRGCTAFGLIGTLALASATAWARPPVQGPAAEDGYTLSVFANGPAGQTKPDSIAVFEGHIYVGYAEGHAPDGSDGKDSTIIEYDRSGNAIYRFSVKGHNDGMKVNPCTENLWVLQNEDGNPSLVVFDPETRVKRLYTFQAAPANGGGYDDIAFRHCRAYLSASNPQAPNNNAPAIVGAEVEHGSVEVKPVLQGNAAATDILSGQNVTLNLQDPDSMTLVPGGDLLLDSQADSELVLVRKPGSDDQSAVRIQLSSPLGLPMADDTLFTPSSDGFMLIVDTGANIIYKLTKAAFAPDVPYTSAVAGGAGFVGRLDLDFGMLTPVVTGLNNPHGLAFVQNVDNDARDHHRKWDDDDKRDHDHDWKGDDKRDNDGRRDNDDKR